MDQDYEGTLSADAGTADDEGLSPGLDTDTQDSESGDQGSGGSDGTDNELTALRAEAEELRKRVSFGTRTAQELRAAQEKIKANDERFARWKAANLDPDEIDKALGYAPGTTQAMANQASGKQLTMEDVESAARSQTQMQLFLSKFEDKKDQYFDKKPALDTPGTRRHFDAIAYEHATKEIEEFGRVISTPGQIFQKAEVEFNKITAAVEKDVQQRLTEKRVQVGKQGVVDSSHQRSSKKTDDDEPEDMNSPEYLEKYTAGFRNHASRVRSRK
jgi:hypothetical protein